MALLWSICAGAKNARKGTENTPWPYPLIAPSQGRRYLSRGRQARVIDECGAGSTPGPSPRCRGAGGASLMPLTRLRSSATKEWGGWRGISGAPRYLGEGRMAAASSPEEFRSRPRRRPRCLRFRFTYRVSWIPFPSHTARRPRLRSKVGARAHAKLFPICTYACAFAQEGKARTCPSRDASILAPPHPVRGV